MPNAISKLDTETADRDLTATVTVLTHTPSATVPMWCQGFIALGSVAKPLDGTGGNFELTVSVGGQVVQPAPQYIEFAVGTTRAGQPTVACAVDAGEEVVLRVKSPNPGDADVACTAKLYAVGEVLVLNGTTGLPSVDVGAVVGSTQSAADLKDFADAGYDPSTHLVAGVPATQHVIVDSGTVTTLTNAPPDSSGVTTLLARLGAWTGSGLNTVLGAFRAALAKAAALTPTDISTGTTYDNTTDSQEAIHDSESAAAPTAAAIADAVWDELSTGHISAGKAGEQVWTDIDAIKQRTDLILSGRVTVAAPVSTAGDLLTLVKGDDYSNTDGRRLDWTCSDGTWPTDLTLATIAFEIWDGGTAALTTTGTVVTPTGTQKVGVELTAAQTDLLSVAGRDAGTRYSLVATLGTREVTLATGDVVVLDAGRDAT